MPDHPIIEAINSLKLEEAKNLIKTITSEELGQIRREGDQATPLHLAVALSARNNPYGLTLVDLLIQKGADVNATTNNGITPLHWNTSIYPSIQCLLKLIEAGADINAKIDNHTPLDSSLPGILNRYTHGLPEYLLLLGAELEPKNVDKIKEILQIDDEAFGEIFEPQINAKGDVTHYLLKDRVNFKEMLQTEMDKGAILPIADIFAKSDTAQALTPFEDTSPFNDAFQHIRQYLTTKDTGSVLSVTSQKDRENPFTLKVARDNAINSVEEKKQSFVDKLEASRAGAQGQQNQRE